MSQEALNKVLFHGTTSDVDDAVRPAGRGQSSSRHGSLGYHWKQRSDQHAFATESEDEAWDFADMTTRPRDRPNDPPTGRTRVYTVAPASDQRLGAFHPDHPSRARGRGPEERWSEVVSPTGFPVTGQIDVKPGHQGTIPIDWTPYRRPGNHSDVNHPDPEEVEHGHAGSSIWVEHLEHVFGTTASPNGPPGTRVPKPPGVQLKLFKRS